MNKTLGHIASGLVRNNQHLGLAIYSVFVTIELRTSMSVLKHARLKKGAMTYTYTMIFERAEEGRYLARVPTFKGTWKLF
jgi:hypothetical protein